MVAEAKRGYIYEYDDGKCSDKRFVLVMSSDTRATDRMVNTLMFGDSNLGHDVVRIESEEIGGTKYLHCGMITYAKREFLVKELCKISPEDMEKVEYLLCRELSLRETIMAERDFYKNVYQELLNKLVNEK